MAWYNGLKPRSRAGLAGVLAMATLAGLLPGLFGGLSGGLFGGLFGGSTAAYAASGNNDDLSLFSDVGSIGVPLAAGAFSLWQGDTEGAVDLGLIWGASVGTTWALKKTVDATRPNGKPESFPSRHAASAFAGASYLQYRYGWKYAGPAYVVALGVGYARVDADEHYWRDIAVSAGLANLSAWLLTSRYEPRVSVAMSFDPATGVYGLRTGFRF